MIDTKEILYILGFILVMSGVIQSSNKAGVEVSQNNSFFSVSNIGKMASIAIFINSFFVFRWWLPLITFVIAIPLGPLIYLFFAKLKIPFAPQIQVILGIVISAISLSMES
jgi:hypothetical protein